MLLNLSIIIPHQNQLVELNYLLERLTHLDDLPGEIIIIAQAKFTNPI